MLKALVWKEYREQLPVALAGMATSLVLPFVVVSMVAATISQADPMDIADVLRFVLAVMVWPIFAAAIGATTFAGDGRSANLGFLLSRPVARGWIWLAKTLTGMLAVVVVVGLSWLVSRAFDYLIAGPSMRPSLTSGLLSGTEELAAANVFALIALSFTLSVLFAGLWDRPLTAAGCGLAAGLGLVLLTNAFWDGLRFRYYGGDPDAHVILIQLGLVSMAILVVSLYAFARGDLLERRAYRWRLATGAGVVVVFWIVCTAGILYAETRLEPSYARLSDPRLMPSGEGVIVRADRDNHRAQQVWMIRFNGELVRLTPRLTDFRGFSEDGVSFLYYSWRGWLGLPARERQLRAMRLDGTDDRLIGENEDYYYFSPWVSSPDGRMEAGFEYERSRYNERRRRVLVVATSDGTEVARLDLREIGSPYYWAWTEDSSGIVFNRALTLTQYDLATGEFESLVHYPAAQDRDAGWSSLPNPLGTHVRLSRGDSYGDPQQVIWAVDDIDIETGEISTIFEVRGPGTPSRDEWYCDEYVRLSEDRTRFFYTTCVSYPHSVRRTREVSIHVVDLETMEERIWTTIEGSFFRVRMAPRGERMLVQFNQPLVDWERDIRPPAMWDWRTIDAIVEPDGTLLELEDGWLPIEWMDQRHILATYRPGSGRGAVPYYASRRSRYSTFTQLAILNVETGQLEIFYP